MSNLTNMDVLQLKPCDALRYDIGSIAKEEYELADTFELKHTIFGALHQHAKERRSAADDSYHAIEQARVYLNEASDYAKLLSSMTRHYIGQELSVLSEDSCRGINWVHYAKILNGDGVSFLRTNITKTGLFLSYIEQGLSVEDSRKAISLKESIQEAVQNENYLQAANYRDQIAKLIGTEITTLYSVLNE